MMMRDFYKILILGASGRGKTYSFRNMNPDTTGFINVENKPLPFQKVFKHHARILSMSDAKKVLKEYSENSEINCIVFDSFSAYIDLVLAECRKTKKGYDIWSSYNDEISKILNFIKNIKKEVFITAHYEWISDEGGVKEKRVKVKGKEWEGVVEKEFTVVLYAENKLIDKKPKYSFLTFLENSSSKCPPDIFGEDVYEIENDSEKVFQAILKFAN